MKRRDGWKEFWLFAIRATVVSIIAGSFAYFLIQYREIAQALTPWATLLLALAAFWAIRQNYSLHKRERKERLLNEIIEWAEDVLVCALSIPTTTIFEDITHGIEEKTAIEQMVRRYNVTTYTNIRLRYQTYARKSKYIENVASGLSRDLGSAVKDLSKQIDDVISKLRKCAKDSEDKRKYENLLVAEDLLHGHADILIEKATKIKTKDIGGKEANMSKEGEATGNSEPTMKDIEEHLKQQDKQTIKGTYLTGAAFGAAIALVGISLFVQRSTGFSELYSIWFLILVGLGFMFWCKYKQSKIK